MSMKGISKSLENTLEKIKSDEIDSLALIISTESIELQKEIMSEVMTKLPKIQNGKRAN